MINYVIYVIFDGFIITYKHPIFYNNEWIYPKDISKKCSYKQKLTVYNFEMKGDKFAKKNHTIIINGIVCATLGGCPTNLKTRNPKTNTSSGTGYWIN